MRVLLTSSSDVRTLTSLLNLLSVTIALARTGQCTNIRIVMKSLINSPLMSLEYKVHRMVENDDHSEQTR